MTKYAFFDVDKTIYKGYSENKLMKYVSENKLFGKDPVKQLDVIRIKYERRDIDYNQAVELIVDVIADIFKGQKVEEVEKIMDEVIGDGREQFEDWFFPTYELLKEKGFRCVLVSGSNEMIIKRLAKIIGDDIEYYCTIFEIEDGVYTGKHQPHMNGEYKKEVVEALVKAGDDIFSIAFGDSPGDIPMLETVDKAFVFAQEEHREMEDVVESKGWHMFKDEEELLSMLNNYI
jgi:HAD superfamily hydrolase (TIGR01490 family)